MVPSCRRFTEDHAITIAFAFCMLLCPDRAFNLRQQNIPRVFRSLEKNEERARGLLTWIQEAISSGQLRDLRKPGSTYLSSFLKKDEYIPKPYEPLLPSSLRKLG